MKKKYVVAGIALSIAISLMFSGCGKKEETGVSNIDPDATYPIQTEETLTIWAPFSAGSTQYASADELPYIKEYEKQTGIDVQFIHPPQGQEAERLKIMLASGDVADIIHYNFLNYTGGPQKAISEGHIIRLNELMDTYAKDFKETIQKYPEADKLAKTADGDYYTFPQIIEDDKMTVSYGPVVRKDWLDELGLPLPETLDDWYTILKAFKEKKGASAPLIIEYGDIEYSGIFMGAYGVKPGFYVENGTIKYGPIENGYKDALAYLNKLYSEGLLTENVTSVAISERDSLMLNNQAGAAVCWLASGMEKWQNNSAVAGTGFDLSPTVYPTLNKGETAKFGARSSAMVPVASISGLSNKKELAAKFLNYTYTEKGRLLPVYGIEGQSYEMRDGKPYYTDLILNNPDGLNVSTALSIYAHCGSAGTYLYKLDDYMQIHDTPRQITAMDLWSKTNAKEFNLPSNLSVSEELSSEYSKLYADIKTYTETMFFKFVMGVEPLDKYDEFVDQLKKMNIDRIIEINQQTYDQLS